MHRVYIDKDSALVVYPEKQTIYKSSLKDSDGSKKYDSISLMYRIEGLGFSKTTYFFRGEDSLHNAAYFTLMKNQNKDSLKFKKNNIIENTRKGLIADDGFFISSTDYSVFAKYHKNEFFIMDDIENKKIKTIANKVAYPRIHESERGTVTIMGEVNFKNLRGTIDNNTLYLQSGVKADNEKAFRFKFNSIIDTYNLNKEATTYQNSFYIPSYAGVKCNSFMVKDNILYAIYGNYLITYTIDNE
ncbi:MAG: hypothetical protein ACK5M1_15455 [Xanthomarina gelatinilytica]|uniref:hypothetical protein n=1 Tax=Xanthomarina gelatinilytica TaxID=1137281 RepID=UPI003A8ADC72